MTSWPEKILHIDDDPMILQLVRTIFERAEQSFTVESCDSGKKALEIIEAFKPDLILLDINMPDMKADDFLSRLYNDYGVQDIPVILATGYDNIPDILAGAIESFSIIGTIHKPFSPASCLNDIKDLWDNSPIL